MDTKTSLLNIGLELFGKSPYEAVGVQDIVAHAHVTKPTLYHHFGSKLGFYQAVFDHFASPFFDLIIEKSHYKRDLTNNLNEISCAALAFFQDNPTAYWLIEYAINASVESEHHDFVSEKWKQLNQAIETMFTAAIEQHGNLKGKTALTSWLFIHAIRAEVFVVLTKQHPYTPDLPYKLVHQFMYGIFA